MVPAHDPARADRRQASAQAIGARSPADRSGVALAPPVSTPGSSIAVLPFNNVSDSDENAYFADGVSEELMYLLTRTPGLRVASRTSAFAYRDLALDVRDVARRLNVDWILEGSVRRAGEVLRVVARLTDARNGFQVWSESFDRTAGDIFAIQEEIAVEIANRLMPTVSETIGPPSGHRAFGASDPVTYDLYLLARFKWHRRTEESLRASATLFEEVVARAPEHARAWSGLADAYAVLAFYDYLPPRIAFPRAETAARHALELDPALAASYTVLAYVDTYYHWNWTAAEEGFHRAIELEPTNATAHQWYGNLLTTRGQFDAGELEMRRAAELDPLSRIAHAALGWVFLLANEHDRAIEQLHDALRLDPNFQLAHYWLGLALTQGGRSAEAIAALERALALSPGCALVLAAIAHAHAAAGDTGTARRMLRDLLEREEGGLYISSYQVAKVCLTLGDREAALARLERAYADRAHSMAYLGVDPQLRALGGDDRFRRLVEMVG